MTRWFPWGEAPETAQEGDLVWRVGARDQVFSGGVWTLVCPRCDAPMAGRSGQGGLVCSDDGTRYADIPLRQVAP